MTATERIGLIGLGPMGHGMGRNIVTKGYSLTVLGNRNRAPVDSLKRLGAAEATDIGALAAASDIVILCLPSSIEVEDLVLRSGGLAETLAAGAAIVDCSTSNPVSTEMIAERLAARGIGFVDAPLTRTSKEAEAGTLNVLLGGEDDVVTRVTPVIRCFGENLFRAGAIGTAHRLKLINNFLSIGCSLVVAEAVIAARAAGVDTRLLFDLASQGGANSGALQMIMPWINDGDMRFRFAVRNAAKDIGYFNEMVEPSGGPLGATLRVMLDGVVGAGKGDAFMPELVYLLAAKADG
jgi:3-hydroxyisobutyrate dehydrogenase-like beta-hydroxyacid dehydrogenase